MPLYYSYLYLCSFVLRVVSICFIRPLPRILLVLLERLERYAPKYPAILRRYHLFAPFTPNLLKTTDWKLYLR